MLRSILNLEGAQGLTKNEQKEIKAGTFNNNNSCQNRRRCPDGSQPLWAFVVNGCQQGHCAGNIIITRFPQ